MIETKHYFLKDYLGKGFDYQQEGVKDIFWEKRFTE